MNLIKWIREHLEKAVLSGDKDGVSSTRMVWLATGILGCLASFGMTAWGVAVYAWRGQADLTYWGANAAMWTAIMGFVTSAKNEQKRQAPDAP